MNDAKKVKNDIDNNPKTQSDIDNKIVEVNELEKLLVLPNPYTCPHGRPTAIKMSKADLEKKFFRRK